MISCRNRNSSQFLGHLIRNSSHGCSCSTLAKETSSSASGGKIANPFFRGSPVTLAFKSYESRSKKSETPLIIQHNLLGCKNNWTRFAKELNHLTRRKVISVDARNHGESPHDMEMSYGVMAQDIQLLIKQQEIQEKISFMGAGMGGRVGMYLALAFPQSIDKLIVINSTPLPHPKVLDRWNEVRKACLIMKQLQDKLLEESSHLNRKTLADQELKTIFPDNYDRGFFLTNLTNSNDPKRLWTLNLDSFIHTHENGIFPSSTTSFQNMTNSKFEGKVLFISGENSKYLAKEDKESIKQYFPNAQFNWIPNTGYWIHAEKYPELLEQLISFLQTA